MKKNRNNRGWLSALALMLCILIGTVLLAACTENGSEQGTTGEITTAQPTTEPRPTDMPIVTKAPQTPTEAPTQAPTEAPTQAGTAAQYPGEGEFVDWDTQAPQ